MSGQQPGVAFSEECRAPAELVYDLLADARTHLDWGGRRQAWYFRLRTLKAPEGPMTVGSSFTSSGSMPATARRFEDRSRVVAAERPTLFEFVTESTVPGRRPMRATYRHRYEVEPLAGGCRVSYRFSQEHLVNGLPRLTLPLVRDMSWKIGIPMMMRRGFRNLLREAQRRADVIDTGDS